MIEIKKKEELDEILNTAGEDKLVVLKYHATWCQPCQMLSETIEQIKDTLGNVIFVGADCDEVEEELVEMNHVTNIPKMVYYKEGLVVDQTIGNLTKDVLLQKISENLSK